MAINRRDFLKSTAAGAIIGQAQPKTTQPANNRVALVRARPLAPPVLTAIARLRRTLKERGVASAEYDSPNAVPAGDLMVLIALKRSRGPESFSLSASTEGGRRVVRASGEDPRGLVYALLELADRVENADQPLAAMSPERHLIE